jgi:Uma2 family endonuclease
MLENMGAKAGVSVTEYLHSSFPDLDREYRDGELLERSLPDYLHGRTQALLLVFFEVLRRKGTPVYACSETRMKLREGLYLIPDVAAFWPAEPASRVPESPPLVAVEILSLDDRLAKVRDNLEEYKAWGVPHVWLVDPHSRRMYTCQAGLNETRSLPIPELRAVVTAEDIFE